MNVALCCGLAELPVLLPLAVLRFVARHPADGALDPTYRTRDATVNARVVIGIAVRTEADDADESPLLPGGDEGAARITVARIGLLLEVGRAQHVLGIDPPAVSVLARLPRYGIEGGVPELGTVQSPGPVQRTHPDDLELPAGVGPLRVPVQRDRLEVGLGDRLDLKQHEVPVVGTWIPTGVLDHTALYLPPLGVAYILVVFMDGADEDSAVERPGAVSCRRDKDGNAS